MPPPACRWLDARGRSMRPRFGQRAPPRRVDRGAPPSARHGYRPGLRRRRLCVVPGDGSAGPPPAPVRLAGPRRQLLWRIASALTGVTILDWRRGRQVSALAIPRRCGPVPNAAAEAHACLAHSDSLQRKSGRRHAGEHRQDHECVKTLPDRPPGRPGSAGLGQPFVHVRQSFLTQDLPPPPARSAHSMKSPSRCSLWRCQEQLPPLLERCTTFPGDVLLLRRPPHQIGLSPIQGHLHEAGLCLPARYVSSKVRVCARLGREQRFFFRLGHCIVYTCAGIVVRFRPG